MQAKDYSHDLVYPARYVPGDGCKGRGIYAAQPQAELVLEPVLILGGTKSRELASESVKDCPEHSISDLHVLQGWETLLQNKARDSTGQLGAEPAPQNH